MMRPASILTAYVALASCTDEAAPTTGDAAVAPDAGAPDAASPDASGEPPGGHAISGSPFGFHPGNANQYSYLRELGAVWSREITYVIWSWVDPRRDGELSFRRAQAPEHGGVPGSGGRVDYDAIRAAPPEYLHVMSNVCPFDFSGGELVTAQDKDAYAEFVRLMVERYDGDADLGCGEAAPDCYREGDDEYPSDDTIAKLAANPVKHWQVCNQLFDVCDDDCPETYAAKFAEVQRLTYDAVKAADPDAQVLIAGDSQMEEYPAVFAELAGGGLDIVDLHRFGTEEDWDPGGHLAFLTESLVDAGFDPEAIRFWITETGTYSGDPQDRRADRDLPLQSERQQASGLVEFFVAPLALGVEKVFWAWNIVEGFGCDCCIFDYTGLVYDGNEPPNPDGCDARDPYDLGRDVKKLGYYSFQLMFDVLDGATRVQEEPHPDGIRLFRFDKSSGSVWVAWNDVAEDRSVLVTGIRTARVRITEAVPDVEAGRDVLDFASAFPASEQDVVDGGVELHLGDVPSLVEELPE